MLIIRLAFLVSTLTAVEVIIEAIVHRDVKNKIRVIPNIPCEEYNPMEHIIKGEPEDTLVTFTYNGQVVTCSNGTQAIQNLIIPCPSKCQLCPEQCGIKTENGLYTFSVDNSQIDTNHESEHGAAVFHMVQEERDQKLILRTILVTVLVVSLFFFGFVYGSDDY